MEGSRDQIDQIQTKIDELKRRWPAHSVPPALLQELDELEEALEEAIDQWKKSKNAK